MCHIVNPEIKIDPFHPALGIKKTRDLRHDLIERKRYMTDRHFPIVNGCHIQHIIDQFPQILRLITDLLKILPDFCIFIMGKLCNAQNPIDRCAKLMGHPRKKQFLCLSHLLLSL